MTEFRRRVVILIQLFLLTLWLQIPLAAQESGDNPESDQAPAMDQSAEEKEFVSAETRAILEQLKEESRKAEERFQIALNEQRDEAAQRERLLIGLLILILLTLVAGIILYESRKRRKSGKSHASLKRENLGDSPGYTDNTVIQKPVGDSEYILDGRDEEGIRYVISLTGEELVQEDGVVLGRNPANTRYLINHADVSRRHARLSMANNRVFIEDLGSTNGTSINGQSIDEKGPVAIANGDQLIIGSVVMKLSVLHE